MKPIKSGENPNKASQEELFAHISEEVRTKETLRAIDFAVGDFRKLLGPIKATIDELHSGTIMSDEKAEQLARKLGDQLEALKDQELIVHDKIRGGKVSPDQLFPNKLHELAKLSDILRSMRSNIRVVDKALHQFIDQRKAV